MYKYKHISVRMPFTVLLRCSWCLLSCGATFSCATSRRAERSEQVINGFPYFKRQSENTGGTTQALFVTSLCFIPSVFTALSLLGPNGARGFRPVSFGAQTHPSPSARLDGQSQWESTHSFITMNQGFCASLKHSEAARTRLKLKRFKIFDNFVKLWHSLVQ